MIIIIHEPRIGSGPRATFPGRRGSEGHSLHFKTAMVITILVHEKLMGGADNSVDRDVGARHNKTADLPIRAVVVAHSPVALVLYRPIGAGDGEERRRNMLGRRHAKINLGLRSKLSVAQVMLYL